MKEVKLEEARDQVVALVEHFTFEGELLVAEELIEDSRISGCVLT